MAPSSQPVFLFDMMRHRSHLVFRYLSTHPAVQSLWHPYLLAYLYGPERITQHTEDDWTRKGEEGAGIDPHNTYAIMSERYATAVHEAAQKGKILVANEHSQMLLKHVIPLALIRNQPVLEPANPTTIPDNLCAIIRPIFIIRHPVFAVLSNYMAFTQATAISLDSENWKLIVFLEPQRRLFDHFHKLRGAAPLIVDGDDVVWRTQEVGQAVGTYLGIDPDGFRETWDKTPQHHRSPYPVIRHFLQTIDDSTGIEKPSPTPPDPDLTRAHNSWKDKYGVEVADQLRNAVEINMPHYEHMKSFQVY